MSFLPGWWSQGVQGQDNNGGFGTAGMFNKTSPSQQGDLGYIGKLISALRNKNNVVPQDAATPMSNAQPDMTPYQGDQVGPDMGQVNKPYAMSPNGQIMPNWNRKYGGY